MSDPGVSVGPTMASIENEGMIARAEAVQQNLATQGAAAEGDPSKIQINNLDELREKYPEIYRALQESLFDQIRRDSDRYHKRLIKRIKEWREGD